MGWKLQLFLVGSSVVVGLYLAGFFSPEPPSLDPGEGWWGRGKNDTTKIDTFIRSFKIEFPKKDQDDLKRRLQNTRFFESLDGTNWEYGVRAEVMREVADHWLNEYSWEKQEKVFNQYNHFKTNIEGIDIHFLHVKPKVKEGQKVKPILMVHGWPGSFYEFYKIIPMLTDPASHGGTEEDVFEVICPSLPGYGFSEASHKPGLGPKHIARIFNTLMHERLRFKDYYVQGGDWGANVVEMMSLFFPEFVRGHHTNFQTVMPPLVGLRLLMGHFFPEWTYPNVEDRELFSPATYLPSMLLEETGYQHIQATKPDTLGHALTDSPVGLAAYILEKFLFSPIRRDHVNYADAKRKDDFVMDDLLNNIMTYWIPGSFVSCMRSYKELWASFPEMIKLGSLQITVPTGYAALPYDGIRTPEHWLPYRYTNVISYTSLSRGSHFAAMEQPQLLAMDIRHFAQKVEEFWEKTAAESWRIQNIRGHHSNFLIYQPPFLVPRLLVGSFFPSLVLPAEHDQKKMFPVMEHFSFMLRETGYMHIQATKPDTVGHGLTDSPVGLAAYILEKFSTCTDPAFVNTPDGGLSATYDLDDLLNNVMVYWISGSITSSMRLYKESFGNYADMNAYASLPISVPTGYACFFHEVLFTPENWLSYRYKNVVSYHAFPVGGHFAAFEQPKLLTEDLRKFSQNVEDFYDKQNAEEK